MLPRDSPTSALPSPRAEWPAWDEPVPAPLSVLGCAVSSHSAAPLRSERPAPNLIRVTVFSAPRVLAASLTPLLAFSCDYLLNILSSRAVVGGARLP